MKLINGLLSNKLDFLKDNELFNDAIKMYSDYSLFINYLKFRFQDCYDMQCFINNLTITDKENNTQIYQRKEREYKAVINRLYGPFFSGRETDEVADIINKNNILQIVKYIIESCDLNNNNMKELFKKANVDNVYDFYTSLYLQRIENNYLTDDCFDNCAEEDEEFILWNYTNLRHEQDGRKIINVHNAKKEKYNELINYYKNSEIDNDEEPNELNDIINKSSFDYRTYNVINYHSKLKGALLARFAGCMLGTPVENWSIESMEKHSLDTNTPFPPTNYWNGVVNEQYLHYKRDKKYCMCNGKIGFVVADDDVTYTVLNALVLNKYGLFFTSEQLANFWKEHLPYACTAEYETIKGLRRGKNIDYIVNNNPYVELIGAAIRADCFGYVCPGNPSKAAMLAYKDACMSHKRNGIYAEMFLAASIAASFVSKTALDAVKLAINYIPKKCRLKQDLLWALSYENKLNDYKQANKLISNKFKNMNRVHANNNMCAIVFSLILGNNDFSSTISNCIAMGYDNDCTGASVGSLIGANVSIENIDKYWYECFNDEIHTYIRGYETIKISKLLDMLEKLIK